MVGYRSEQAARTQSPTQQEQASPQKETNMINNTVSIVQTTVITVSGTPGLILLGASL